MLITEPKLPPKAGYVEVEIDGERVYQKIPSPYANAEGLEAAKTDIADLQELTVDNAFRLVLLELGVI